MKVPAAALFVLVPGLVLFPVLAGQTQFFYRDVTRQYEPLQAQLDRAWASWEWPAWNSSTQSGVPLMSNLHAGAFAPWAPLFRLLPFPRAYGLAVALAWATWMGGLYALLRRGLRPAASAVGALTGGFTGVVLGATSYLPFLAGLACIPWQLLSLQHPLRLARVTALAMLFTCQVLTGDPSTALMGGLACLLSAWLGERRGGTSSLLAASGVAVGLSALQLLPAWTLFEDTARASSSLETRLAWSFHPARMLEWVVRLPWGQLLEPPYFTRWDLAVGPDAQPFLLEHGWGLMAVLMLGPALTTRGPLRRLGVMLVAVGAFLSLGRHLGPLQQLFVLPPFSLFRFPERYGALCALGAATLTGHGASTLLDTFRSRFRWALAWLGLGGVLAAAALLTDGATSGALLHAAGLVGAAALAALLLARVRWAWLLALLVVAALDGARAARASVLTLPAEPTPTVADVALGGHRLWRENAWLRGLERPVRGRAEFAQERRDLHATFASATPGLHGVDELGGFSPVSLRRWQRVLQATTNRPELLASLFDVCWFVSTAARGQANPGWSAVTELSKEAVLYESRACRGRAWTVGSVVDVSGTEEALQQMLAPGFDEDAVATRERGGAPLPPLAKTAVRVAPRASSSWLELTVEPGAQWALVAVSETWAPGWRAWVDGAERPVELLDGTLLGVAVPPGGRVVTLRYVEPLATTGLAISAATALLLLFSWLRQRRSQAAQDERVGALTTHPAEAPRLRGHLPNPRSALRYPPWSRRQHRG